MMTLYDESPGVAGRMRCKAVMASLPKDFINDFYTYIIVMEPMTCRQQPSNWRLQQQLVTTRSL